MVFLVCDLFCPWSHFKTAEPRIGDLQQPCKKSNMSKVLLLLYLSFSLLLSPHLSLCVYLAIQTAEQRANKHRHKKKQNTQQQATALGLKGNKVVTREADTISFLYTSNERTNDTGARGRKGCSQTNDRIQYTNNTNYPKTKTKVRRSSWLCWQWQW